MCSEVSGNSPGNPRSQCRRRKGRLSMSLHVTGFIRRIRVCRLFGTTTHCSYCEQPIASCDMVMKAKKNVYHLECFACFKCQHRSADYFSCAPSCSAATGSQGIIEFRNSSDEQHPRIPFASKQCEIMSKTVVGDQPVKNSILQPAYVIIGSALCVILNFCQVLAIF